MCSLFQILVYLTDFYETYYENFDTGDYPNAVLFYFPRLSLRRKRELVRRYRHQGSCFGIL